MKRGGFEPPTSARLLPCVTALCLTELSPRVPGQHRVPDFVGGAPCQPYLPYLIGLQARGNHAPPGRFLQQHLLIEILKLPSCVFGQRSRFIAKTRAEIRRRIRHRAMRIRAYEARIFHVVPGIVLILACVFPVGFPSFIECFDNGGNLDEGQC